MGSTVPTSRMSILANRSIRSRRSTAAWTLRERLDYRFLRLFVTDRYKATEAELDAEAARSTFGIPDALAYLEKVRDVYFDGQLPVEPDLSYLDIGCGMGRLAIGLAAAGARDVTGIEIVPRMLGGVNRPSLRLARIFSRSAAWSASGSSGLMSSTVKLCRANGSGQVGNGCVGLACSPGTSEAGTGRSSIGQIGSPVSRFSTKRNACFVGCASALIVRPPLRMSNRIGALGRS